MKVVLIIPPIYNPFCYHLSVPLLAGQLYAENIETISIDANIGLFNHILSIENAEKQKIKIKNKKNNPDLIINFSRYILEAKALLKDKNYFYNINNLRKSEMLLNLLINLTSFKYDNYRFNIFGRCFFDYNLLNLEYFDKNVNSKFIFDDYYLELIKQIEAEKPDLIGFSVSTTDQIIPSLKLLYLLKKLNKFKIVLGGNLISRVINEFSSKKLLFQNYCDFIIKEHGEKSIVELCKYLENKISIDNVSNLIYCENNKIIENDYKTHVHANFVHPIRLNGIKLNDYLLPENVVPIQLGKGCYWNKCTFCTHTIEKSYSVKNMDSIIQEIKYLNKNGINKFKVIDESVSPYILDKFSEAIIQNRLDVRYTIDAKFEKDFTRKLLHKAYISGLRIILWGFETGSKRIHKLMNKGDIFEKRYEILNNAYKCGIFNHLFIIHGFPTATINDELNTLNFIEKNSKIIGSFSANAYFGLPIDSYIYNNPKIFAINRIYRDTRADFDISCGFKGKIINSNGKEIIRKKTQKIIKAAFNYYSEFNIEEIRLLYLSHFNSLPGCPISSFLLQTQSVTNR